MHTCDNQNIDAIMDVDHKDSSAELVEIMDTSYVMTALLLSDLICTK